MSTGNDRSHHVGPTRERANSASARLALSGVRVLGELLVAPLLAILWIYRRFVSPALPPSCRYYPSCSQYAEQALQIHGALRGTWLAARRLFRCHPFCEGGPDPVPPRDPARTQHPRPA